VRSSAIRTTLWPIRFAEWRKPHSPHSPVDASQPKPVNLPRAEPSVAARFGGFHKGRPADLGISTVTPGKSTLISGAWRQNTLVADSLTRNRVLPMLGSSR